MGEALPGARSRAAHYARGLRIRGKPAGLSRVYHGTGIDRRARPTGADPSARRAPDAERVLATTNMKSPGDIRILEIRTLRGPNRWTYPQVIEAVVDIGALEDYPSNLLPGFPGRLKAWIPSLVEHRCSYGERGGFLRRLEEGTWPCHIMEHVTLELQSLAGMPAGFGKARETSRRGVYKVVVSAYQDEIARTALHEARELLLAAIEDRPYDLDATLARLRRMVDRRWLGPSTACIVEAAEQRRIPATRLNDGNLVQLGYGAAQRRIWTAETDRTSAIAEGISRDKDLTKQLLAAVGVPVPEGEFVRNAAEARQAAESLGFPVVVKPYDGNHGRGVFTHLTSGDEVEAAYAPALAEGSGVIVERFIRGFEHRLLVVAGRLVAAARGDLAFVTGDGRSTIDELIASQLNSDPLRGNTETATLNLVRLDSAARLELAREGLDAGSILPEGRRVLIQRNGNVAIDCTDAVHPSTAALASLAARTVGLDIAGIDLVVEDISRPLAEQGGAIVEVNAGPGLLMHVKPAEGTPRPVGAAIVDHLFPAGEDGRIPIVGISGHSGTTAVARLVAHLLRGTGRRVGVACADGLTIDARPVRTGDCTDWQSGHSVLLNRTVDVAVIENPPRTIAEEGLAYDRCLVGVVTGLDPSATMADLHIDDADALYGVLRTQVDVVLGEGASVLNADDERVLEMAGLSDGQVILYGRDGASGPLAQHRADGRRAVFARGVDVVLATGAEEAVLGELLSDADPQAVLPAVAVAWALRFGPEAIRSAVAAGSRSSPAPRSLGAPALQASTI
jgi:cyanophycin synthetase